MATCMLGCRGDATPPGQITQERRSEVLAQWGARVP